MASLAYHVGIVRSSNADALAALERWVTSRVEALSGSRDQEDPLDAGVFDWLARLAAARAVCGDIDFIESWLLTGSLGGLPDELLAELTKLARREGQPIGRN